MKLIYSSARRQGFTLTELMIVVAVIGLLAAIAFPSYVKARDRARSGRYIGDLRIARQAFILHLVEQHAYPADGTPGVVPSGMTPYLGQFAWSTDTSIGGQWDWDYRVFGFNAGVSVDSVSLNNAQMAQIDKLIDDGNSSSGAFQSRPGGYISIIE